MFKRTRLTGSEAGNAERSYSQGTISVAEDNLHQLRYAGVDADTLGILAAWSEEALALGEVLADRFYSHLLSFPETATILTINTTVEKQKPLLISYFESLFGGEIDDAYFEGRAVIGTVHDRIGLGPLYYAAMYRIFFAVVSEMLCNQGVNEGRTRQSHDRLQRLDSAGHCPDRRVILGCSSGHGRGCLGRTRSQDGGVA